MFTPAALPCPESGRKQKQEWKSSLCSKVEEIKGNKRRNNATKGTCNVTPIFIVAYDAEDGTGTSVIQWRGKGSYRPSAQFGDEFKNL